MKGKETEGKRKERMGREEGGRKGKKSKKFVKCSLLSHENPLFVLMK